MKKVGALCLIGSLLVLLSGMGVVASKVVLGQTLRSEQDKETSNRQFSVYVDRTYGFRVQYDGTLIKRGTDEYVINLPSSTGQASGGSKVRISVAQQPFVYLPGTYGGRYYFNEGKSAMQTSDRVQGDSIRVNGLEFARDYWAACAGMGHWETVINCYTFHDGQCYLVSLSHNFLTPKPGEIVDGSRITKQQIRAELIGALRDTANSYVKSFNQILGSFTISK